MRRSLVLTALVCAACARGRSAPERDPFADAREVFVSERERDLAERRAAAAAELERVLAEGDPATSPGVAARHFWASYYLAQIHTAAADDPFLTEPSTHAERLKPIAAEASARTAEAGAKHSDTAHLVSALDHAGRARRLLATLDGAPAPPVGWSTADEPTPPPSAEALGTNLALLMATAYARLGFRREVGLALAEAPRLLEPTTCLAFMEDYEVRPELRPWVCEMVSTHLRESDELFAYRFAILAIEGEARFGHALPRAVIDELEAWILNGATSRFVCPLSQTGYIPGRERSPLSGIRHLEYVAVSR